MKNHIHNFRSNLDKNSAPSKFQDKQGRIQFEGLNKSEEEIFHTNRALWNVRKN